MRYTQKIDESGILAMPISGKLFLLDDIGAAVSIQVEVQRGQNTFFNAPGVKRGLRVFTDNAFDAIRITGLVGAVISFFIASENVQISTTDAVTINNPVGNPVNINAVGATFTGANMGMLSPTVLASVSDVLLGAGAATLIVAADAVNKEREVIVKNLFANAAIIRVGDAASGAARGHELNPGESITLNTMGAVYAFCAAAQSVSVISNSRA